MSAEYFIQHLYNIFFSAAHGTFSKIDHIVGHKEALANTRK
jgi:hypothetical protein